jgi:hypothetical protein
LRNYLSNGTAEFNSAYQHSSYSRSTDRTSQPGTEYVDYSDEKTDVQRITTYSGRTYTVQEATTHNKYTSFRHKTGSTEHSGYTTANSRTDSTTDADGLTTTQASGQSYSYSKEQWVNGAGKPESRRTEKRGGWTETNGRRQEYGSLF